MPDLEQLAMREMAERDAAYARCPIDKKPEPECPRCGATARDACGVKTSADYRFVENIASALRARAQKEVKE